MPSLENLVEKNYHITMELVLLTLQTPKVLVLLFFFFFETILVLL